MTIGRPLKSNAIKRTGRLIHFWIYQEDAQMLEHLIALNQTNISELLRELIRKAYSKKI